VRGLCSYPPPSGWVKICLNKRPEHGWRRRGLKWGLRLHQVRFAPRSVRRPNASRARHQTLTNLVHCGLGVKITGRAVRLAGPGEGSPRVAPCLRPTVVILAGQVGRGQSRSAVIGESGHWPPPNPNPCVKIAAGGGGGSVATRRIPKPAVVLAPPSIINKLPEAARSVAPAPEGQQSGPAPDRTLTARTGAGATGSVISLIDQAGHFCSMIPVTDHPSARDGIPGPEINGRWPGA